MLTLTTLSAPSATLTSTTPGPREVSYTAGALVEDVVSFQWSVPASIVRAVGITKENCGCDPAQVFISANLVLGDPQHTVPVHTTSTSSFDVDRWTQEYGLPRFVDANDRTIKGIAMQVPEEVRADLEEALGSPPAMFVLYGPGYFSDGVNRKLCFTPGPFSGTTVFVVAAVDGDGKQLTFDQAHALAGNACHDPDAREQS